MHASSLPAFQGQALTRADGLLLLANTPKGRGVFASTFISKGTIIEVSPVLVFTGDEVEKHTSQTCLQHYTYYWPSANGKTTTQAIALGLGSMFNHSATRQNVVWKRNVETQCIIYTAHQDIEVGEEMCISYGNGRLWFEDTDAADSDDEWSKLQKMGKDNSESAELDISGIGNIAL